MNTCRVSAVAAEPLNIPKSFILHAFFLLSFFIEIVCSVQYTIRFFSLSFDLSVIQNVMKNQHVAHHSLWRTVSQWTDGARLPCDPWHLCTPPAWMLGLSLASPWMEQVAHPNGGMMTMTRMQVTRKIHCPSCCCTPTWNWQPRWRGRCRWLLGTGGTHQREKSSERP